MSVILQVDGLRYLYGGMAGRGQVTDLALEDVDMKDVIGKRY
jgi:hypothetical protein